MRTPARLAFLAPVTAALLSPCAAATAVTLEHERSRRHRGGPDLGLDRKPIPSSPPASTGTIVDVAASNPDFTTLVTAVKAAGLTETLAGPGPFTVFAPTNEAFAKVPKDVLDNLLANKEALTKVLTYHVLAGEVKAADVMPGM